MKKYANKNAPAPNEKPLSQEQLASKRASYRAGNEKALNSELSKTRAIQNKIPLKGKK